MNRPLVASGWILIATLILVAALLPFDPALSERAQGLSPAFVEFNRHITDLGTFRWMIYGSGGLVIAAYIAQSIHLKRTLSAKMRTAGRLSLYLFLTIGSASALVHLLKFLIGRARPELLIDYGAYSLTPFTGDNLFESFPSGHSAAIGSFCGAFAMLVPRLRPYLAGLALVIGISRVVVGAHYPSDVAAGLLIGLWLAVMMAFVFARFGWLFRIDEHGWPAPKQWPSRQGSGTR